MKKLIFLLSAASLCALASGCAGQGGDSGPEFFVPDKPRPTIRDEFRGYYKDSDTLINYTERYIAKCMKNAGFDYEPEFVTDENDAASVLDETDVITTDQVRQNNGYIEFPDGGDGNTQNPGYARTPAAKKEAWDRAYLGEEKTDAEINLSTPDPRGFTRGFKGGCANDAEAEQYGSLENADNAQFVDSNLILTAFNFAADDPDMTALNKEWSQCMKDAGYSKTADGTEITEPALAASHAGFVPDQEFDIAMADATCQEGMNYGPQRTEIEDRYLTAVADHYEADIQGALEIRKEALERSKREFG